MTVVRTNDSGSPIADAERAEVLDALRGFALLGIVVTHMPDFSGYSFLPHAGREALNHFGIDAPLASLAEFLIRGKFFSLFSFLFGIGFAVQIDSTARRGRNFTRHFTRRLIALLVIGAVHASLWYGDILKDYALIGFALMLTARWSLSALIRAAAVVLAVRMIWPAIMWFSMSDGSSPVGDANVVGEFSSSTNAFYGTDLIAIFRANMDLVRLKALQIIYDGRAITVLLMFLLGAWVGRMQIYKNLRAHEPFLKRVLLVCAPIGVIGNAVIVPIHAVTPEYPPSGLWVFENSLYAIAAPALAFTYASGFALLWLRGWERFLSVLAPAGRMALTTYVSQTLIGMFIFYGVGLNFGNRIGFAESTAVAVAIFAIQCVVCRLWLKYFRFGPLEWIWRRATYGTPVAIVRRTAVEAT